jgi:putative endonuclease
MPRRGHDDCMAAKDELGRAGEARAASHLELLGYQVVARNWRHPEGELDIVAVRGNEVAVIEVKARSGLKFGHPFEAIDERKRKRLWRLAYAWVKEHPELARGRMLRIHAIAITGPAPATGVLEHLQDLR